MAAVAGAFGNVATSDSADQAGIAVRPAPSNAGPGADDAGHERNAGGGTHAFIIVVSNTPVMHLSPDQLADFRRWLDEKRVDE